MARTKPDRRMQAHTHTHAYTPYHTGNSYALLYRKRAQPTSKWLHARTIVIPSSYNSTELFFVSLFAIFSNNSLLDWSIYFILKRLNARIILTEILSKSIQQLLRYCQFHVFAIFSNSRWWPSWNAKLQKIKMAS